MVGLNTNECRKCKHLKFEEDGIPGESIYFWYECDKTQYHNLKTFPFKKTKCQKFEERQHYFKKYIKIL